MDRNDQQAIQSLFEKLAKVEPQAPSRDPEAEAYIHQQIARQPGAPYYMAQTIVVQEQALNAAQARIEELEQQAGPRQSSGGLLSNIFGNSRQPSRSPGSVPRVGRAPATAPEEAQPRGFPQRTGGGFLAGAAQTAMGVAGGVLLGNAIAGMFGGNQAQAAEPAETSDNEAARDEAGFDDGGDFGDIEF
ncbi:DUF2076 domain-containing protein [Allomesorhizobium camelthorni]|uniref:DUF2076 domain-containing protein n=1 Tax=Allomesorhizobium camelthorni TaxID=475069 RepID=A0A6G4WGM7_9HYPH|nr:DUF2076 domain-containing protein [Mesorhizobium camelthorni]NGO53754.1 DUF2076 domain-containing protein [Mesorhizobium camelthorni]